MSRDIIVTSFLVRFKLSNFSIKSELCTIVETLKEFKNILLGFPITVYTDHKNLTHDMVLLLSERFMQWQLLIGKFGPKIKYIKVIKNVVADALSRLHTKTGNLLKDPVQNSPEALEEILSVKPATKLKMTFFLLYAMIMDQEQRKAKELLRNVEDKCKDNFKVSKVDGHYLITDGRKIVISSTLHQHVVSWYHYFLCHLGKTQLTQTI